MTGRQPAVSRRPSACRWLLALLPLLASAPAAASPFEIYGFGSRATAMGGAQGAAARNHTAIFYNPANLALREQTHFGAAINFVAPKLSLELGQPDPDVSAVYPHRNVSLSLGFAFPLGGRLDHRLAIGFALTVPLVELTRVAAVDPARPHFYLYDSLSDNLIIAPAVGVRVTDWLRVGIGVQILATLGSNLAVTGDLVRRRIEERSLTVDLSGATAPTAGLHLLFGAFEAGVTFRDELDLRYTIPVAFLLEGVGNVILDVSGSTLYVPRQINIGLAYTLDSPDLTLAFDTTIELWSQAPSPAAVIDATIDDTELRPNEDEPSNIFDFETPPFDLGAANTVVPRFGLEWRPNEIVAVRGGYFHRPTPIPDQTGYSNILDAAANVLSLGLGVTFDDPWQIHETPASIDFHVQWTNLRDRTIAKDPARGATFDGELTTGGSVWNVGIELRHDF